MARRVDIMRGYAQKYIANMLKKGLIKGEDQFTITPDGVVLSERYGGGTYATVSEAYEAMYTYMLYPEVFQELYSQAEVV